MGVWSPVRHPREGGGHGDPGAQHGTYWAPCGPARVWEATECPRRRLVWRRGPGAYRSLLRACGASRETTWRIETERDITRDRPGRRGKGTGMATLGTPSLLEHRDGDPLCPCPSKSCAGDLAIRPFWSSLARNFFTTVFYLVIMNNLLLFFTPLVTLGSATWTHAWSAVLCALYLANNCIAFWIPFSGLTYGMYAPSALSLESRLQVRAASLAVSDLVVRLRDLVKSPSQVLQPPEDESDLPYIALHHLLAPCWQRRFDSHRLSQSIFAVNLALSLVYAFIYSAGSSCIPAWALTYILVHCPYLFDGLLTVARFNAGLTAVQDLYRLARAEIRRLRARSPTGPAADALEAHDAVLSEFVAADGKRATYILDVRVDYGVVRVFAVTVLTVFGVLWGVLRGVGVGVTLESVCPGGGAGG
ncbi:hypothetical protein DFJ74DRAFT_247817 [Hyaloraphidium curvatum]|nr:hypothetical protein DFJ74DRAFT_247817 [Hyaloraphidium curvatum]